MQNPFFTTTIPNFPLPRPGSMGGAAGSHLIRQRLVSFIRAMLIFVTVYYIVQFTLRMLQPPAPADIPHSSHHSSAHSSPDPVPTIHTIHVVHHHHHILAQEKERKRARREKKVIRVLVRHK